MKSLTPILAVGAVLVLVWTVQLCSQGPIPDMLHPGVAHGASVQIRALGHGALGTSAHCQPANQQISQVGTLQLQTRSSGVPGFWVSDVNKRGYAGYGRATNVYAIRPIDLVALTWPGYELTFTQSTEQPQFLVDRGTGLLYVFTTSGGNLRVRRYRDELFRFVQEADVTFTGLVRSSSGPVAVDATFLYNNDLVGSPNRIEWMQVNKDLTGLGTAVDTGIQIVDTGSGIAASVGHSEVIASGNAPNVLRFARSPFTLTANSGLSGFTNEVGALLFDRSTNENFFFASSGGGNSAVNRLGKFQTSTLTASGSLTINPVETSTGNAWTDDGQCPGDLYYVTQSTIRRIDAASFTVEQSVAAPAGTNFNAGDREPIKVWERWLFLHANDSGAGVGTIWKFSLTTL